MSMFKTLSGVVVVAALTFAATASSADTRWQNHHPRREQVNNRLARQNHRITAERKEGDITGAQARSLRQGDRAIRAQERASAATNGGHITRAEQATLNHELNANSAAIGK